MSAIHPNRLIAALLFLILLGWIAQLWLQHRVVEGMKQKSVQGLELDSSFVIEQPRE